MRAALTPRTKAVLAVHLFGNVAPVREIEALGVPVIEDAAQAAGSQTAATAGPGRSATLATFSLLPVQEPRLLRRRRRGHDARRASSPSACGCFRFHGSYDKVTYDEIGCNSRLDDLQAAILRVQLPHARRLGRGARGAPARHYEEAGLGELVTLPDAVAGCEPAWHLYVVRHPRGRRLAAGADASAASAARPTTARPCTASRRCAPYGSERADLPGTEAVAADHLAIPMSPVLSAAQAREVVDAVGSVLR